MSKIDVISNASYNKVDVFHDKISDVYAKSDTLTFLEKLDQPVLNQLRDALLSQL